MVKPFSVNSKAVLFKQEALTDHYWAEQGIKEDTFVQIELEMSWPPFLNG